MKGELFQRTIGSLTDDEIAQLSDMIIRHEPGAEQSFIDSKTKGEIDYDIVLLKAGDNILASSYYLLDRMPTPYSKRKLHVIYFSLALKMNAYRGSTIKRMGNWYCTRNIGLLYLLKRIVGITMVSNPRVMEKFIKLFRVPFSGKLDYTDRSKEFIDFYLDKKNMNVPVLGSGVVSFDGIKKADITDDWDLYYKAKDESINQYFVDAGVIEWKGSRIYKTEKGIVLLGERGFPRIRL